MDQLQLRTVADYVALLRRRKWLVVAALVIAPAIAFAWSESQPKLYSAYSEVLLTDTATGVQSPLGADASAVMQTQEEVASSPAVAKRVLTASHVTGRSFENLISETSFSQVGSSDVLRVTVRDRDPAVAQTLATTYARQYSAYRRALDGSFLATTRKQLLARMATLRAAGDAHSAVYSALAQKVQELVETQALDTASAVVIRPAGVAAQVEPRPIRAALLGLLAGLILGIAIVFLWDGLDSRLRTGDDIGELLGLPLLGRLAAPAGGARDDRLVMLGDPNGPDSEGFRILRTNLDLVNIDQSAKLIMVTSALPEEGKSTTASNLAVALARSGRRVVLVDLDLRRPTIARLFGLPAGTPGLTDVLVGDVALRRAMVNIPIEGERWNDHGAETKPLKVLPVGTLPPDPGELAASSAVRSLLARLAEYADVVIVDSPPLLGVGETIALGAVVDGIVLLTRLGTASKRPVLLEVRRILQSVPAAKLGFAITDAAREEAGYRSQYYQYYSSEAHAPRAQRLKMKVRRSLASTRD